MEEKMRVDIHEARKQSGVRQIDDLYARWHLYCRGRLHPALAAAPICPAAPRLLPSTPDVDAPAAPALSGPTATMWFP